MSEPVLDMSEIIDLYKEDARGMIARMQDVLKTWSGIVSGSDARKDLRRWSHQLRGSGRTYGFRSVTRISKAIEKIVIALESQRLTADDRVRQSLLRKVSLLESVFKS